MQGFYWFGVCDVEVESSSLWITVSVGGPGVVSSDEVCEKRLKHLSVRSRSRLSPSRIFVVNPPSLKNLCVLSLIKPLVIRIGACFQKMKVMRVFFSKLCRRRSLLKAMKNIWIALPNSRKRTNGTALKNTSLFSSISQNRKNRYSHRQIFPTQDHLKVNRIVCQFFNGFTATINSPPLELLSDCLRKLARCGTKVEINEAAKDPPTRTNGCIDQNDSKENERQQSISEDPLHHQWLNWGEYMTKNVQFPSTSCSSKVYAIG